MRILYLSHTPWDWILQRPQLLALELEKYYDCLIVDRVYFPKVRNALKPNQQPKKIKKVIQLRGRQIHIIDYLDDILYKVQIGNINKYDAVWLCNPLYVKYIPLSYTGHIIYDCMDNHVALAKTQKLKNNYNRFEQETINRADIIFSSSQTLIDSKPGMNKAVLIRNGFIMSDYLPVKKASIKPDYILGYFGAIDSWFDLELLRNSCNRFSNITYNLIGPCNIDLNIKQLDNCNNINMLGSVDHDSLGTTIANYDALIMPFQINDIVLAVDPVKLYEYIAYGKPVISIYYPEIQRFEPYVYFYSTEEEYIDILSSLVQNGFKPKYTEEQRKEFLSSNTWYARGKQVIDELNSLNDLI